MRFWKESLAIGCHAVHGLYMLSDLEARQSTNTSYPGPAVGAGAAESPVATPSGQGKKELSTAAKIGITVGVLVPLLLGLLGAIIFYVRKHNRTLERGMIPRKQYYPTKADDPPYAVQARQNDSVATRSEVTSSQGAEEGKKRMTQTDLSSEDNLDDIEEERRDTTVDVTTNDGQREKRYPPIYEDVSKE